MRNPFPFSLKLSITHNNLVDYLYIYKPKQLNDQRTGRLVAMTDNEHQRAVVQHKSSPLVVSVLPMGVPLS